uniref:DNA methyltransferase n=1 Tax=Thioalkalivibrio sp. HK1 TaxID=1469245 RepID=UPI0004727115
MRLSWNEIRSRAIHFSDSWKNAHYEKGETQSFYNAFFSIFDLKRRSVARYEEGVKKLNNHLGFIDLFWPGTLLVEQKSAGRNLDDAYRQAGEYFDALAENERPRYILVSDFKTFDLRDLDDPDRNIRFDLADLHRHVENFGFMIGVERKVFRDQDPVNIEASYQVGNLHDALVEAGHSEYDLERFLVRIVFCLFADNTGIFDSRNLLLDYIESRTGEDGSDLGPKLGQLFDILDTPIEARPNNLDEDLARFPYINGDLFKERLRTFSFDSKIRKILLEICQFNWSNISPAIFGALFQSVMEPKARRELGAHYTTEHNILKVIDPLFMDDLREEFEGLKARKDSRRQTMLRKFHNRLGSMKFLDPACGCGNFLIITYRELRLLEIEVLKEIYPKNHEGAREAALSAQILSLIDVDRFYGIEIEKFPACIAETAMWMMDHIMNNELSTEFSQHFARIPLEKSPHIINGDALEMDWKDLLPAEECSFILGNPPFIGSKLQSKVQRAQVHRIANSSK